MSKSLLEFGEISDVRCGLKKNLNACKIERSNLIDRRLPKRAG